jgi:hypothetical protein
MVRSSLPKSSRKQEGALFASLFSIRNFGKTNPISLFRIIKLVFLLVALSIKLAERDTQA